jgi:sugar phosphate isomerase/epimerase
VQMFQHAKAPDNGKFGRISINAYCFNSAIDDTSKGRSNKSCVTNLLQVLDFAAKYHVDAIDPTGYFWPGFPNPPSDADIKAFQDKASSLGIVVSGTGARNDFAQADPAARAHDVGIISKWIEVCAKLGAPVMRVFAGPVPLGYEQRWEEVATWMAANLRECTVAARLNGVKLGIQNHGDMLRTSDQMLRMLEMVDSEWLGVINDTGYYSTPDPYLDIERMMPYTVSIQVKESVRPVKRQHPFYMDLPRLMKIVHDSGYQGFLPIETLPTVEEHAGTGPLDYNPGEAVPAFLTKLRAAISTTTGEPLVDTPPGIVCMPGMAIE